MPFAQSPPRRRPTLRLGGVGAALVAAGLLAACGPPSFERLVERNDARLRAAGFLRTDPAPADVPYDAADLARNFERIAFFVETEQGAAGTGRPRPVRKWRVDGPPITWSLRGADAASTAETETFMARLARLTGAPLRRSTTPRGADITIYILDPEERYQLGRTLRARGGTPPETLMAWIDGEQVLCLGFFRLDDDGWIESAIVGIPQELTPLYMRHCVQEELAQTMGLTNDDTRVRPSIFNDRNEFALLTRHDEDLLRILYDERLRPGMTAAEAMPLVPGIIEDQGLPSAAAE
ncbi:MAG: DUF2927 domain-containing protein [Pseudomonadota bacterium]